MTAYDSTLYCWKSRTANFSQLPKINELKQSFKLITWESNKPLPCWYVTILQSFIEQANMIFIHPGMHWARQAYHRDLPTEVECSKTDYQLSRVCAKCHLNFTCLQEAKVAANEVFACNTSFSLQVATRPHGQSGSKNHYQTQLRQVAIYAHIDFVPGEGMPN